MGLFEIFKLTRAESIISAGVLEYRGERFFGNIHEEAYERLIEKYPDADLKEVKTGFLTSAGRFITDRCEATKIAEKANQLTQERLRAIKEFERGELHSEDLHN